MMSLSQEPFTQKDFDEIAAVLRPTMDKVQKNNEGI